MRLRAPTQGLSTRITSRDEVFHGVKVPKGSWLHLRWASANLDPDEWECPLELKLDRKAGKRHLTFSQGARVCPGAALSRLEQMVAWTTLLDRVESFAYAEKPRERRRRQPEATNRARPTVRWRPARDCGGSRSRSGPIRTLPESR